MLVYIACLNQTVGLDSNSFFKKKLNVFLDILFEGQVNSIMKVFLTLYLLFKLAYRMFEMI